MTMTRKYHYPRIRDEEMEIHKGESSQVRTPFQWRNSHETQHVTGFTSQLTSFHQTILCSTEKKPTTTQTIAHLTKTEYWNSRVRKSPEMSMGSEGSCCPS